MLYCIATLDFCYLAHSHITVFGNYQISTSDITMVQYFLKKIQSVSHATIILLSKKVSKFNRFGRKGSKRHWYNRSQFQGQNAGNQRLQGACGLTLWDLAFARLLVAILYEKCNKNHRSHMFIKMAISVFSPSMVFIVNLSCVITLGNKWNGVPGPNSSSRCHVAESTARYRQ